MILVICENFLTSLKKKKKMYSAISWVANLFWRLLFCLLQPWHEMSIAIRVDENYYKLTYDYKTDNQQLSSITIPYPELSIHFDIIINNTQLKSSTYGAQFLTQLSKRFANFWNNLEYDSALNISDDSNHTFDLNLKCQVFSNYAASNHLRAINLSLTILTDQQYISLEEILVRFNYLLDSWYLQSEINLPLVFSCIGRKFVKINAFWYRKCRQDILGNDSFEIEKLLPSLVSKIMQELVVVQLLQQKGKLPSIDDVHRNYHNIVKAFSIRLIDY